MSAENSPETQTLEEGTILHLGPNLDSDLLTLRQSLLVTVGETVKGWQRIALETAKPGEKSSTLVLYRAAPEKPNASPG